MISYIIIFLISLLGFLAGIIIAKFSKEELKEGMKYFRLAEYALLLAIILIALLNNIVIMLVLVAVTLTLLVKKVSYWHYPVLLIAFLLSTVYGLPEIAASLILVYGLVKGSEIYYERPVFLKKFKYLY